MIPDTITDILADLHERKPNAADRLMPLVYADLRRIAASKLATERPGHTFQPTDLIHETFIRLVKPGTGPWQSRAHFFGVASQAMREILVDHARSHGAQKRGGSFIRIDLSHVFVFAPEESSLLLELDEALKRLEKLSRRQSRVVELRFFAGLTIKETAEVLDVGVSTIKEEWAVARAWLERELG